MKTPTAEILSQGEEVLTGQIVDTNSAWLSERLVKLGFTVTRHSTIGDRLDDMINVFQEITTRTDVCICTGGLGPTSDDLTAQAVSNAFQLDLIEDTVALAQIEQYFASRQKHMPAINRRQALLPLGSTRLDNDWGTAPGFSLFVNNCLLICVPGVPYEMRQLFDTQIEAILEKAFQQKPWQLVILRTVGMGESDIQQCVQQIDLPEQVTLSFRAGLWENQTKLLFPPAYSYQKLNALTQQYAQAIGESVFSIDGLKQPGGSLVEVIARLLKQRNATVSLLETVSSGKLAAHCAGAPWLAHATTVFRAEQLLDMYDVHCGQLNSPQQLISATRQIAKQLCDQTGSDYSLVQLWAITGDLELFDNTDIPVVTVALGPGGQCRISEVNLHGPMRRRHTRAAVTALDLLRELLLKDDRKF